MEDDNGGLLNIELSSDESVTETAKVPRDFQSEEDFQRQRREWKVKVETGEVCTYPCKPSWSLCTYLPTYLPVQRFR